jgi:hypothetical protein
LSDAVDTVLGLNICLRVPVAVEKDHLRRELRLITYIRT